MSYTDRVLYLVFLTIIGLAIISFSSRYSDYNTKSFLSLVLSIFILTLADNVFLVASAWLFITLVYSLLAQHDRPSFRFSGYSNIQGALYSSLCLFLAIGILVWHTNEYNIFSISSIKTRYLYTASILLLLSVTIFQLLTLCSSLSTNVSAFLYSAVMSAGIVVLVRFHEIFLSAVPFFVMGALNIILGTLCMQTSVNIKCALSHSALAQMGFAFIYLGLGNPKMAIAHAILHGFFIAYCFLNSGSAAIKSVKIHIPNRAAFWISFTYGVLIALLLSFGNIMQLLIIASLILAWYLLLYRNSPRLYMMALNLSHSFNNLGKK